MKHIFLLLFSLFVFKDAYATTPCIRVDRVVVKGASAKLASKLQKHVDQFSGRCLDSSDITLLLREVTNYYGKLGYITSFATLPEEQDLKDGNLIVEVKEGYIETIEVNSLYPKIPLFLPIKEKRLLSLRDIEQTYDQYSKVKNNTTNITIHPGEEEGASRIIIDNKQDKKWSIINGLANNGTKQKGEWQSFNNLIVEDLFGLNEQFSFNFLQSLDDPSEKYTNSKSISAALPIGYNNLSFSYNVSKDRNLIHSRHNTYTNRGNSKIHKIAIDRLIHRDEVSKTYVSFGLGKDIYSSYLDESKIQISSYKISKATFGISHQRRLSNSIIIFNTNITTGINKSFYSNFQNIGVPAKKFTKIGVDISWLKPLPIYVAQQNMQYRMQFLGQYSPNILTTSEKFSMGGIDSIRGFKDYKENAENISVIRNELIAFLPKSNIAKVKKFIGDISIFTAFDIGQFVSYEERYKKHGVISGIAAGIRNNEGIINFSITLARPFQAPLYIKHKNVLYMSFGISL